MAGIKGKSGGPRKNAGGARPGAGRKPKPPAAPIAPPANETDALKLLQDIAFGRLNATTIQLRAAIAAVQYTHTKRHDGGKRDEQQDAAKKAASGRFSASAAPLKLVGRK